MFKLPSQQTKPRLRQVLFFGCLLHRRPTGEGLPAAGSTFSGCSVLAAAAGVAVRDARRCRLHPCQPTRTHPVSPRRRRLTCPESRQHRDPEDSRGNQGILDTRGLTCNWSPTNPLSASCSGRRVSAPPNFLTHVVGTFRSQNLQMALLKIKPLYKEGTDNSFDQESTSALLRYQL